MGCSASVSATPKALASADIPKENGHWFEHEPTQAPASTPEPEITEENSVRRAFSDAKLFEKIKADLERANEFSRRPLQLDNGEKPFLPSDHLTHCPVITTNSITPSESQTDFFRMLDEKIAEGPDYTSDQSNIVSV